MHSARGRGLSGLLGSIALFWLATKRGPVGDYSCVAEKSPKLTAVGFLVACGGMSEEYIAPAPPAPAPAVPRPDPNWDQLERVSINDHDDKSESEDEEICFYDEVEIDEMDFDEQEGVYTMMCPCGDLFAITEVPPRASLIAGRCWFPHLVAVSHRRSSRWDKRQRTALAAPSC